MYPITNTSCLLKTKEIHLKHVPHVFGTVTEIVFNIKFL